MHVHLGKDGDHNQRDNSESDANNHEGSEHSINEKFYPMEVCKYMTIKYFINLYNLLNVFMHIYKETSTLHW